jgi:hypothetical protein
MELSQCWHPDVVNPLDTAYYLTPTASTFYRKNYKPLYLLLLWFHRCFSSSTAHWETCLWERRRFLRYEGAWRSINAGLTPLQLWKSVGDQQPSIITAIEIRLWRVLFDIVSLNTAIPDLLSTILADVSTMGIHDLGTNYANWFRAGEGMCALLRVYLC